LLPAEKIVELARLLRESRPLLEPSTKEALPTSEWWAAVFRLGAIQVDGA
jgi:hypothetical protein